VSEDDLTKQTFHPNNTKRSSTVTRSSNYDDSMKSRRIVNLDSTEDEEEDDKADSENPIPNRKSKRKKVESDNHPSNPSRDGFVRKITGGG